MEKVCYCSIFLKPRSRKYPEVTPKLFVSSAELVGNDIIIHLRDDPVLVPYGLAKGAVKVLGRCSNCPPEAWASIDAPSGSFHLSGNVFLPDPEVSGNE